MSSEYPLRFALDLQFFGDDKTEEATSKKLSDTRKKGQVAKSQELAHGVELAAMFIILRLTTSFMGERFIGFFRWIYNGVIIDAVKTVRGGPNAQDTGILLMNVIIQMIIVMLPLSISHSRAARRAQVLFPDPEGPTRAVTSPSRAVKLTPRRTCSWS